MRFSNLLLCAVALIAVSLFTNPTYAGGYGLQTQSTFVLQQGITPNFAPVNPGCGVGVQQSFGVQQGFLPVQQSFAPVGYGVGAGVGFAPAGVGFAPVGVGGFGLNVGFGRGFGVGRGFAPFRGTTVIRHRRF